MKEYTVVDVPNEFSDNCSGEDTKVKDNHQPDVRGIHFGGDIDFDDTGSDGSFCGSIF